MRIVIDVDLEDYVTELSRSDENKLRCEIRNALTHYVTGIAYVWEIEIREGE